MKEVVKKLWNNYKVILIAGGIQILLFLVLLPGFWQPDEDLEVFEGQVKESLEIPLGAYDAGTLEVAIEYFATGGGATVSAATKEDYHRSIYFNETILDVGSGSREMTLWLPNQTKELFLVIRPEATAEVMISRMEVSTTKNGSYMASFLLILLSILLDSYLLVRCRGKKGNNRPDWIVWGLLGTLLISAVPLFVGYCLNGTQLEVQLLRIEQIREELEAGHFWRSIQADWLKGERYPETLLEGNLFLILPALLRVIGFPVQTVYTGFLFFINWLTVLIAYKVLFAIFREEKTALLGCILYTWAPYRLYIMYGKASLGELFVFCLLPVVIYGLYVLLADCEERAEGKFSWLWLVCGLTGVLHCSLFAFEMAVVLVLLTFVFTGRRVFSKYKIWDVTKVFLAIIVLNLWYFIPLAGMMMRDKLLILQQGMQPLQDRGLFAAHFFMVFWSGGRDIAFGASGLQNSAPLGLGLGSLILLFVFCWMIFTGRYHREYGKDLVWNWGSKLVLATVPFVILATRYFPWDIVRNQYNFIRVLTAGMESPAECLPMVVLGITLLGCMVFMQLQKQNKMAANILWVVILVASFWTTQYLLGDMLYYGEVLRIYDGAVLQNGPL